MSRSGFEPILAGVRPMPRAIPASGGALAVPDFDAPPPREPDPAALAADAEAALQAQLAAARAEGFAAGETAGLRQAAESHAAAETAALGRIAAALEGAAASAGGAVAEAAEALARLLLAALDAALPAAAAQLAPERAAELVAILDPLLRDGVAVTLSVAPGCGAEAAACIGDARLTVEEDAALAPGDARASWRGGGAVLSLAEQRGAVAGVLAALGLQEA